MKNTEEIENDFYEYIKSVKFIKNNDQNNPFGQQLACFKQGYAKCQQDNSDKKYTEKDMLMSYNKGCNTTRCEYEKNIPEHIKPMSFDEFINFLNDNKNNENT